MFDHGLDVVTKKPGARRGLAHLRRVCERGMEYGLL